MKEIEITKQPDGSYQCKGSVESVKKYLNQDSEIDETYEVEMMLRKLKGDEDFQEEIGKDEDENGSYNTVSVDETIARIDKFNKTSLFNILSKKSDRRSSIINRRYAHQENEVFGIIPSEPDYTFQNKEALRVYGRTTSFYENVKSLPSPYLENGVKYYINQTGYYYIYSNIESFPHDAIMIRDNNVVLDFDSCHIKPNSFTNKDHRDSIQIIPNGGGSLHYAAARISGVGIWGANIKSNNVKHKLQGITGFDGVYENIELIDIDIETPNQTKHEITFNGLLSGTFNNVSTNNGYILLAPIRLCGGRDPNETIWLVEPFKGNNDEDIYLYKNINFFNNNSQPFDGRRAFRTMSNGALHPATDVFKEYSYRNGNKVYSRLNLDAFRTYMEDYKDSDLDTVISKVMDYVSRHAQEVNIRD